MVDQLESLTSPHIVVALSEEGAITFRNNVGLFRSLDGKRKQMCGLGVGSSDRIGWTAVTITQEMVGSQVPVFTAIECKRSSGGKKLDQQTKFIDRVQAVGGIAGFANGAEAARVIVREWIQRRRARRV
jgi:hypothetical protein